MKIKALPNNLLTVSINNQYIRGVPVVSWFAVHMKIYLNINVQKRLAQNHSPCHHMIKASINQGLLKKGLKITNPKHLIHSLKDAISFHFKL